MTHLEKRIMHISLFDYDLPTDRIAQYPAQRRDHSRLMWVNPRTGTCSHHVFSDLPELLNPSDVLVRNTSRVLPARLVGHREQTGGGWEGLFLEENVDRTWTVLATTRGQPQPGERIVIDEGLSLELLRRGEAGRWVVRPRTHSNSNEVTSLALLEEFGQIPLPPYIRKGRGEDSDRDRYQTTFANQPGSIAAPTAGLHFTPELLERLRARGNAIHDVLLHVGIGTFRPIAVDQIEKHQLHAEWASVNDETASALNQAREENRQIVAVGTTTARTLETSARTGSFLPFAEPTSLYIQPGHTFRGLEGLITNFHLPKSSLLVLVSALAGVELMTKAYHLAIAEGYRFYSYGDAMLILPR